MVGHTRSFAGAGDARSTRRRLAERIRFVLALCAVFASIFALRELFDPAVRLGAQSIVRVAGIGLALIGIRVLGAHWAVRNIWPLSIAIIATAYVLTAFAGMVSQAHAYMTTAVLFVGAALTTATVLPWGAAPQSITVGVATLTLAIAVLVKDGSLAVLASEPAAAVAMGFGLSIATARELGRHRLARRRDQHVRRQAERALHHLNAHLEQRVAARTLELDVANRQLAEEVAEHRRTAAAMRATQAQLADVVDHSTAIVSLKGIDGRYLLVNREFERVFARCRSEVIGRTDTDLFPGDVAAWLTAHDEAVARTAAPVSFEHEVGDDGAARTYVAVKFPLRGHDGAPYGVGSMATDITALKQLEEALRRHQDELADVLRRQTIGAAAAALTDEINQPLFAIANTANEGVRRLRTGLFDVRENLEAFEHIAYQGARARRILRGIGALVRRDTADKTAVDVNMLAAEALRVLEPQARWHGVTVRVEGSEPLPPVRADPAQIEQVMINLMVNGVQAIADRPNGLREVVVETYRRGDTIEVAVSDTGEGIAPAIAPQLFTPFVTTKPHGLGLGLAVSRSIVESHGGRLWASPPGGAGATFRFSLPIEPASPS